MSEDAMSEDAVSEDGPETGTVKWFDPCRGYGFIGRDGATDVFVHADEVRGERPLAPGDRVRFEVAEGRRGLQAKQVELA